MDWTEIEIFRGVDLPASYITECSQSSAALTLILQASLWKESSFFEPLKEDEYVCYKKAELRFGGFTSIEGLENLLSQAKLKDAHGRPDFGEIEEFEQTESGYRFFGKFGEVTIEGGSFDFAIHT